ncbi:DUF2242 domain-containing protein [Haliea sp. E17]|uniref:DUF2242 domain-containing protein n=1 Tax=Haliea sp. E17 TaxID=3401576 RepID=UPI003AB0B9E4
MNNRLNIALLIASVLLLSACSNQRTAYSDEHFASDSPFKKRIHGEVGPACESARRVLLGQGYLIEGANSEGVKARKAVKREDNPNSFIEMNVVCLPESSGSTVFATGLLTTYALKKSSSSASVGVSAIGTISLPIGQSADSLVKVSEDTIEDPGFYQRFFAAVKRTLNDMQPDAPEPAVATDAATPEPPTNEAEAIIATEFSAVPETTSEEPQPGTVQPAAGAAIVRVAPALPPETTPDAENTASPGAVEPLPPEQPQAVDSDPLQEAVPEALPEVLPEPLPEPSSEPLPEPSPEPSTETVSVPEPAPESGAVTGEGDATPPETPAQLSPDSPHPYGDPADWHYDEE